MLFLVGRVLLPSGIRPCPRPSPSQIVVPYHSHAPSSRLKLDHSAHYTVSSHRSQSSFSPARANSPVRPLLVQHTVPALLAADGIAALQRDLVVAVAAQVVHRALGIFIGVADDLEAAVGVGVAEVGAGAGGGGLVLFAGHGCSVVVVGVSLVDVGVVELLSLLVARRFRALP